MSRRKQKTLEQGGSRYVYGYTRISHLDSFDAGYSIPSQQKRVRDWWESTGRGKYPEHNFARVGWIGFKSEGEETKDGMFVDQVVSAFKVKFQERPAGRRLINTMLPGDVLIIPYFNRAFRSVVDYCRIKDYFEERQIHVEFCEISLGLDNPFGKLLAHILAAIAQFDSDLKSHVTREALAYKKSRGENCGGAHPAPGRKYVTPKFVNGIKTSSKRSVTDRKAAAYARLAWWLRHQRHLLKENIGQKHLSYYKISDRLEELRAKREGRKPYPPRRKSFATNPKKMRKWDEHQCEGAAHEWELIRDERIRERAERHAKRDAADQTEE